MAKAALNRSSYVDAALEVIADVGVDKLSMRKVASQLDVSPMAMYKHFPAKDDLLTAALDEFIARANVIPDATLPWDQWAGQLGRGMYHALCRELSWVPLLGSLRLGAQAGAVTDAFVKKLCSAGFSVKQSLEAYYAVIQIVVGAVCLRSSLDSTQRAGTHGDDILAPVLATLLERDQIDIALPLLIDALRARLDDSGPPG